MAEFGEKVHWQPLDRQPGDDRFLDGYYLGPMDGHSQSWILSDQGAFRFRTFRRREERERWDRQLLQLKATVLETGQTDPTTVYRAPVPQSEDPIEPKPDEIRHEPRRLQLKRSDFRLYGLTPGCPGCEKIRLGSSGRLGHNETCRKKMEDMTSSTEVGKRRVEQPRERLEQHRTFKSARLDPSTSAPPESTDRSGLEGASNVSYGGGSGSGDGIAHAGVGGPASPTMPTSSDTPFRLYGH